MIKWSWKAQQWSILFAYLRVDASCANSSWMRSPLLNFFAATILPLQFADIKSMIQMYWFKYSPLNTSPKLPCPNLLIIVTPVNSSVANSTSFLLLLGLCFLFLNINIATRTTTTMIRKSTPPIAIPIIVPLASKSYVKNTKHLHNFVWAETSFEVAVTVVAFVGEELVTEVGRLLWGVYECYI